MKTIWGQSDSEKKYADGITFYSTPSHGGFYLSAENLEKIHPTAFTIKNYGRDMQAGWFEEDCSWAFVAMAFPHLFKEGDNLKWAKQIITDYFPEAAKEMGIRAVQP